MSSRSGDKHKIIHLSFRFLTRVVVTRTIHKVLKPPIHILTAAHNGIAPLQLILRAVTGSRDPRGMSWLIAAITAKRDTILKTDTIHHQIQKDSLLERGSHNKSDTTIRKHCHLTQMGVHLAKDIRMTTIIDKKLHHRSKDQTHKKGVTDLKVVIH